MTNRYDEQANYIEPYRPTTIIRHEPDPQPPLLPTEIIGHTGRAVNELMAGSNALRQTDSALDRDKASLMYSQAYAVAAGAITVGLLTIVWIFRGGNFGPYFFTGLLVWGMAVVAILAYNRAQGLHHSATGVAHHEIDARVEVAKYAIDRSHQTFERVLDRVHVGTPRVRQGYEEGTVDADHRESH